jgi:GT2 family glycosyltransferase
MKWCAARRNALLLDLSIVVPCHNRSDLLRACLASVVRYAPTGTEIIVVDDGSPGAAASAVASEYAGVRAIRLPKQSGFCVAVNAGIRTATHPIIELLNDDTEVSHGWAEAALAWFEQPNVGAVAPLVLCRPGGDIGNAIIDSAGDRYYHGGIAGKRERGAVLHHSHLRARKVFGASGSSAFYRRDLLLRIGCFPEVFGAYFEDVDLAFRLHRASFDVIHEPASRVLHHVSASHGRTHPALLEQQSRNEERVFWRNLPTGALLRSLPAHLAVLAAKAVRRLREGKLLPFLRGRIRAWSEWPAHLKHRRRLARLGNGVPLRSWCIEDRYWG